jgi:hypothetical protein
MVRITFTIVLACKSNHSHLVVSLSEEINKLLLVAMGALALAPNNAGAKDVGNGAGKQFTTGGCVSDAGM